MIIRGKSKRIGEILLDKNFITEVQLKKALEEQKKGDGKQLADTLLELGYITEEQKMQALASQKGAEFVNLSKIEINKGLLKKFNPEEIMKYKFIPLEETDLSLVICTSDVMDMSTEDFIKNKMKKLIEVKYTTKTQLQEVISKEIEPEIRNTELAKINTDAEDLIKVYRLGQDDDSELVKVVNKIILDAYQMGVSDIHVVPQKEKLSIRYRIDGVLGEHMNLPKSIADNVVSRLKTMGGMDISNKLEPLDGKIAALTPGGDKLDLRVNTLPVLGGEKVVMRLMDTTENMTSIDVLGFNAVKLDQLKKLLQKGQGIIFISGPTGSGKSTTLYSSLYYINDGTKNITTAENPVEYYMDGISQSQINVKAGMTFEKILKAMLRQDPDVIMIGEIRDKETAETAVQAANTGHLVLSTVHANDAGASITRLVDMGVRPYMVSESVIGVLSQRLVRQLCEHCKKPVHIEDGNPLIKDYNLFVNERDVYEAVGCEHCRGRGYKGRTTISELLVMDDEVKECIYRGGSAREIKNIAISKGMQTIQDDAKEKVLMGKTTFDEIRKFM